MFLSLGLLHMVIFHNVTIVGIPYFNGGDQAYVSRIKNQEYSGRFQYQFVSRRSTRYSGRFQ